jgi:hypothetical protein
MRDMRKDNIYFEKYLDYQYSRIEKKIAKLKEADEEKKQRILVSLTGFEIDLLKAEFSAGASKENLKILLNKAIQIVCDYKNIAYDDLLTLLSLSVMVGDKSEASKLVKNNIDKIEEDRLLKYIAFFIQGEKSVWDSKLQLRSEFSSLDKVFENGDKEGAILDYLGTWYENHSGYGWYDSHKNEADTYCGYWSFEGAAIAFILGLDDSKLKDATYYPSF